ncbi:hypothetical protein F511_20749 [Dorcoceras hygrometricum]|uniref:Uncharacterized protein n=1 Tax=Dorcoceras hygrometricum TaxID=472368 RepID=A0A2Z7DFR4_9LAMI|nr:hypothetical protein F511_20749 [Dorcoceras hygrometricum]
MRIRPPEIETSICDAKYHVSLFELKLLLVDFVFSARLSEEVTRVSQHFGVLTINSADGYWNQQI